jgi:four helix bundle protein
MKENVIKIKSYAFVLEIVSLYKYMTSKNEYVISKQLLRSGTSIGANVEEADAGISKKDFAAKMSIASKEARETNYWLRLLKDSSIIPEYNLTSITKNSEELIRLLTSIVKTSQKNLQENN